MSAAWTRMPSNSPFVSTATCRLRPFSRLAASQPRGPPLSVVFTLWVSMMAAVGLASRPAPSRSMTTKWGQMPPLAAGAHKVEQTIQQVSHVRGPRPSTGLGGRDQRLQQAKLIIGQCLAGAEVPNQRAISRRPHGGLQVGNHLQRRPRSRISPSNQPPHPFANGHLESREVTDLTAEKERWIRALLSTDKA